MTSTRIALTLSTAAALLSLSAYSAHAASLLGYGTYNPSGTDKSGLNYVLENGTPANTSGGLGSGLAWAGGNTFLALPDRGPNASPWNAAVDNTTSYIPRFHTLSIDLVANGGVGLPFDVNVSLKSTTLLSSSTPLNYGPAVPTPNATGKYYFSGRSDNFAPGSSLNPDNARLDPEGIRLSNDGTKVYVSDEYGPYVYEFDRASGVRTRTFTLPAELAVDHLSAVGDTEINDPANTQGRVANKGMEGLAITPDGKTLYGFVQSSLIQDGATNAIGDRGKGSINRIVTIDLATGDTKQFAYNNQIGGKTFNSSEILALNESEFLVLERDGKGLGDGSKAAIKQVMKVNLSGAHDISGLVGQATIAPFAPLSSLFLDLRAVLNANGFKDENIPAKLEGLAFGQDITFQGTKLHTLYVSSDNDFLPTVGGKANPNSFFVFGVSDRDLAGSRFANQRVPDAASTLALAAGAFGFVIALRRRL